MSEPAKHECENVGCDIEFHGRDATYLPPKDWESGWYITNFHGGCEADDKATAIAFCPWCGVKLEAP